MSARPSAERSTSTRSVAGTSGGGAVLAFAVVFSSALTFGFHAVSSRLLETVDYGGLAALLGIMTALAVPFGAAQAALTRSIAECRAGGRQPSGRDALHTSLILAGVICLLAPVAGPVLEGALRLDGPLPGALMVGWLAVNAPQSVFRSLLLGSSRLRPVGVGLVITAVVRIVALLALAPLAGLTAAMTASVGAELVTTAVLGSWARHCGLLDRERSQVQLVRGDVQRALSAQLALWLLAASAVVLARHTLASADTGAFAAMATASGASLFLPQAIATASFPRLVADRSRRLALLVVGMALALGTGSALVQTLAAGPVFAVLFGSKYRPDPTVLAVLGLHFAALGGLTVVAQVFVARRVAGAWLLWAALGLGLLGGSTMGGSPLRLSLAMAVPTVCTAAVAVASLMVRLGGRAVAGGEPDLAFARSVRPTRLRRRGPVHISTVVSR